jgi:hypothetical protein
MYYSKSALHVSGDVFAHPQKTCPHLQYLVVLTQVAAGWQPAATWVNTIKYCEYIQVLLMMGENVARKM